MRIDALRGVGDGRPPLTFAVSSMGAFTDPANDALFREILKTYKFALI
jgi:hypothetical protein